MTERELLVDCLRRLNRADVAYMLTGSMASNYWAFRAAHMTWISSFGYPTRRLRLELFGVPAFVATAEDVILHKLYWNTLSPSDRQLQDAAGVVTVQGDSSDRHYLRFWASQLKVVEALGELLEGRIRPKET